MPNIAVLASGTGTNLEAILDKQLPVTLVVADRDCRALEIARTANIKAACLDRRGFGYAPDVKWDRAGFTAALADLLLEHDIDLVAMAGFMTVLAPNIFDSFHGPILNTHPSLLPRFKGAHAVPLALAAGVTETGCTVHLATPELDSGSILAQVKVPVRKTDTAPTLHERIKVAERDLYPKVINDVLKHLGDYKT
jgi:phosphoribosylglycinamide formyltransferase 1